MADPPPSPASRLLQLILRQMHDLRDATILGSRLTHHLRHHPVRRSRLAGEPVQTSTITMADPPPSPASRLLQLILRQTHDLCDATILGSRQTHHLRHPPVRRSRLAGEQRGNCVRRRWRLAQSECRSALARECSLSAPSTTADPPPSRASALLHVLRRIKMQWLARNP